MGVSISEDLQLMMYKSWDRNKVSAHEIEDSNCRGSWTFHILLVLV